MSKPVPSHPIVGTWRLASFTEQNHETGAVRYPFGEAAKALVIYEANGYVATIFARSDRKQNGSGAVAFRRIEFPFEPLQVRRVRAGPC
jgi:hypothetical protein